MATHFAIELSPDRPVWRTVVESAIIDALDAHTTMSTQALESKTVQQELVNILLNYSRLYEDLRERATSA